MLCHLITATNISTRTGLQPHELWHLLLQQRIFGPAVNQCLDLLPWPVGSSYHGAGTMASWHLGWSQMLHGDSNVSISRSLSSGTLNIGPLLISWWRSRVAVVSHIGRRINLYGVPFLPLSPWRSVVKPLVFTVVVADQIQQVIRIMGPYTTWLVVYLPLWKILVSWDDYPIYYGT